MKTPDTRLMIRLLSTRAMSTARVAVVLSGCGVYDGSEVHEASAVLTHLSRAGAQVSIYAPDKVKEHLIFLLIS